MQIKPLPTKIWLGASALLLFVVLIVYFLFFKQLSPQDSLPQSVTCVLRMNNLREARTIFGSQKKTPWSEVFKTSLLTRMQRDLGLVEKLLPKNSDYQKSFANNTILAGFTLEESDSLHGLFILECPEAPSIEDWLNNLDPDIRVFPSQFGNQTLYTVRIGQQDKFVFARCRNLLLFSRFSYLVEEGLKTGKSGPSWWDKKKTTMPKSKAAIQFFIRPENLPALFHNKMAEPWQPFPTWFARQINWIGIAWDGEKVDLLGSSKNLSAFNTQGRKVARDSVFSILPDNTALLAWTGLTSNLQPLKSWIDGGDTDFRRYIAPWLRREAAYVITQPNVQTLLDDQCLVLGFDDERMVEKSLNAYGKSRGLVRKRTYNTFHVWEFLHNDFLQAMLGSNNAAFRNPVAGILGNYLVVAPSASTLEVWIDKYVINQTMASSTDYLQLRRNLAPESQGMLLFDASSLPMLLQNLMQSGESINKDIAAFSNLGLLSWDVGLVKNRGIVLSPSWQKKGATQNREASILWKTALKSPARNAPNATGLKGRDKNIFVQDQKNELYCMDQGGTVLWRRQFTGPVLSEVKAIDFYNNQKPCFLFNTAEDIWIVDEKGEDIEGFPLKLQSSATNGVNVADFDGNQKYHFFIACDNGNLYGYDQYGRPLPGWNPKPGVGSIHTPIQHFVHKNKDYLVGLSTKGKLSVFARNGVHRFQPVFLEGTFILAPQCDAHGSAPRITCANTAGKVVVVNLEGSQFDLIKTTVATGVNAYFVFAQLQGDARFDYAVYNGKQLSIKGYEGTNFKNWSSISIDGAETLFDAGTNGQLGLLSSKKRKIWLIDGKGKVHQDFPLAGSTAFTLTPLRADDKKPVLLVGNGASVYAYLVK